MEFLHILTYSSLTRFPSDRYLFTLCLNLSVLLPLADDPKVNNYTLVLINSYWVILGIWWCERNPRRLMRKALTTPVTQLSFRNPDLGLLFP